MTMLSMAPSFSPCFFFLVAFFSDFFIFKFTLVVLELEPLS